MKVSQVVVKDLKKLMDSAGINSYRSLAKISGIDYINLIKAKNGKHIMSEETWNKIEKVL